MRRNTALLDYLHTETHSLDDTEFETVPTPLSCMFRVVLTTVGSGGTVLYRGVKELDTPEGGADPSDTAALDADFCDILSADRPESGWIDAQPSAVRIEAADATCVVKVQWTSRVKPTIA